jgi:hypothetical protein
LKWENKRMQNVLFSTVAVFAAAVLSAQEASPTGHYEGVMKAPKGEVNLAIDIDKIDKGWVGTLDVNMPNGPKGILLEKLTVDGDKVSWHLPGLGGVFNGTYNAEQKTIVGSTQTPGGQAALELKRTGDPKVNLPPPSTPITKDLEGKWEGTLAVGDQKLRLEATFVAGPAGTGIGDVVSLDQGGAKMAMTTVAQDGNKVKFEIRSVAGAFSGALNDAKTELTGEWSQGGDVLPLKLTRAKPVEAK